MLKNKPSLSGVILMLTALYAIVHSAPQPTKADSNSARPFGSTRVGVVDIQAITQKAAFVQELKKKIEGQFDERLKQYKEKQGQFAKLQEEIKRQESVLTEAAMSSKYKQAFQLKAALDEEKFNMDKFLADSEKKEMEPAQERILNTVMDVAQSEGFDVVLRRELLVCGHPSIDISDKVLTRLNAASPAGEQSQSTTSAKKKNR